MVGRKDMCGVCEQRQVGRDCQRPASAQEDSTCHPGQGESFRDWERSPLWAPLCPWHPSPGGMEG